MPTQNNLIYQGCLNTENSKHDGSVTKRVVVLSKFIHNYYTRVELVTTLTFNEVLMISSLSINILVTSMTK